jgi:hypothetical protein
MIVELRDEDGAGEAHPSTTGTLCCYCGRMLDARGRVLTRYTSEKRVELPFCIECFEKEYAGREQRWA